MKSDDLERLEESQEMQQLIRSTKEQYEREKSLQPPIPYSAFAQVLEKKQQKQKSGHRRGISPWWLAAACLLGCMVGYGFSTTVSGSGKADVNILAVTDTVIVVRERVDTVYQEIRVPSQPLVALQAVSNSENTGLPKERVKKNSKAVKEVEPAYISIGVLQQQHNLPDPQSDCYASNGMTVADENYPFHLLMSIP